MTSEPSSIQVSKGKVMRIGLVSYRCKNRDTAFNIGQIELAMERSVGKVDLLCFGEAFIQGFDALCWDYEKDKLIAIEQSSETFAQLQRLTIKYGISLLTGYIEKEEDRLYSSCVVISNGQIIHNYRRISKGWKEFTKTDSHYCEGMETGPFCLDGKEMVIALCGDLWDFPERFKTDKLLIWPVYVNFSLDEWNGGIVEEYASQAALAADNTLMINPIDDNPVNHGGSFYFCKGTVAARIPFDREDILIVDAEAEL